MKKFLIFFCQLMLLFVAFNACKKDFQFDKIKAPTWQPDLAIPLVRDSMTFESGLAQGGAEKNFIIDESGNISILFYYNDDAFAIRPADLLNIRNLTFDYQHSYTQAEQQIIAVQDYNLPPQTVTIDLLETGSDVRLDKMLIKKGGINLITFNSFSNPGTFTVTFPQGTKNGQPFSATINGFVQNSNNQFIDLSGVLFDFTGNPGKMQITFSGVIKKSNRPAAGDQTLIDFSLTIDTIGRFEGFLGHHTFDLPEEYVKINVFNNAFALGTLYFEEPSVSINMINSIGVPAKVTVEEIKAVNFASNVTMDISGQLGANAILNVAAPLITSTHPETTYMEYNNENTNNSINPFINIKPDRVYYKIKTEINPQGTGSNFFRDTSSLRADLRVKFPLHGYFDRLTIQDTFPFNMNQQKDVQHALLRTVITNGLPLMAKMQLYFTDDNYNKIDSLTGTDNIFIKEAPVDPATHLPYPGEYGIKDTTFVVDHDRFLKIESATHILVKAVLNSAGGGNQPVKIKANQMLKLNFAGMIKLSESLDQ